jgi:predicted lipoprotein with Yx(FWY)xxD motif
MPGTSPRTSHIGRRRGLAVACGVALVLTAYGMGSTTALARSTKPTVSLAKVAVLGTVLVDSKGRTLYTFTNDGQAVTCTGACAALWPPLEVKPGSTPRSGHGVTGLDTLPGNRQVTEHGLPLYRYAGDSRAGQANGEGINSFGGIWHVVTATNAGARSSTATTAPKPASSMGGY